MSFELTQIQKMAMPVIEWLFDDDIHGSRATGRTIAIAYYLVEKAINTGREVRIVDHWRADNFSARYMVPYIEAIFRDKYNDTHELILNRTRSTIRIKVK